MFTKLIINGELYLYYNGDLIYKRWLKYGYDKLFQNYKIWKKM